MSRKEPPTGPAVAPPGVVLDTNVTLDWLVFRNPRVAPLVRALETGELRWLACARMRDELAHMLAHPTLARWSPDADGALARFDALAERRADPDPPRPAAGLRCADPDDQIFVELALASGAKWLLTHDRALLKLARRAAARGLVILPPQRWPGPGTDAAPPG